MTPCVVFGGITTRRGRFSTAFIVIRRARRRLGDDTLAGSGRGGNGSCGVFGIDRFESFQSSPSLHERITHGLVEGLESGHHQDSLGVHIVNGGIPTFIATTTTKSIGIVRRLQTSLTAIQGGHGFSFVAQGFP